MVALARSTLLLLPLVVTTTAAAKEWMGTTVLIAPDQYVSAGERSAAHDAEAYFSKAKSAADSGQLSLAMELATRAVAADPDHAEARRVLGYERIDGEWLTPYQAKQHERGLRWHARFGWLRPEEVDRYESGERRLGRRWISAEEDARRHATIDDGWLVRTDRFAVRTNHSLEEGVRLAAELEGLFQVWRQWFAAYWLSESEVKALFAGERRARKRARPMLVYYHRDKAGYIEHLRRRQPRIAETLGIYFDDRREAHFYADPAGDPELATATLYHEAAHQLFAENGPGRRGAGRRANFWLVEGVACYFELLAPREDAPGYTLGNPAQGRLPSAVARGPSLTLSELATLGQADMQRRGDLPALYAQATGLVAMLRHAGQPGDREALVRTLRAVYGGRPGPGELPRQVGRPAGDLDREYQRFLSNLSR